MEKIYLVKGLDCANCAREFEEKVKKIKGVEDAAMNFMSLKLIVKTEEEIDENLNKLATSFEDGLTLRRIK